MIMISSPKIGVCVRAGEGGWGQVSSTKPKMGEAATNTDLTDLCEQGRFSVAGERLENCEKRMDKGAIPKMGESVTPTLCKVNGGRDGVTRRRGECLATTEVAYDRGGGKMNNFTYTICQDILIEMLGMFVTAPETSPSLTFSMYNTDTRAFTPSKSPNSSRMGRIKLAKT